MVEGGLTPSCNSSHPIGGISTPKQCGSVHDPDKLSFNFQSDLFFPHLHSSDQENQR